LTLQLSLKPGLWAASTILTRSWNTRIGQKMLAGDSQASFDKLFWPSEEIYRELIHFFQEHVAKDRFSQFVCSGFHRLGATQKYISIMYGVRA
jgi:hypothetical protein